MEKKYIFVMNDIKYKISQNTYKPGDTLPIELDLVKQYNFSRVTIQKAMKELAKEGLIYRIAGKGTFIGEQAHKTMVKSPMICVIVTDRDNEIFNLIYGIEEILAKNSYLYSLHFLNKALDPSPDNETNETYDMVLKRVAGMNPQGIICYPPNSIDGYDGYSEILKRGIPLILLDKEFGRFPINCVVSDNYRGMYDLTQYLIGLGHTNIAYLSFNMMFGDTLEKRRLGFYDCLYNSHIPFHEEYVLDKGNDYTDFIRTLPDLLKSHPEITAIICANDSIAYRCYPVLTEMGYKIPDDLSICSFDGFEDGKFLQPPLTSMRQNLFKIGQIAADAMISLIKGNEKNAARYFFKYAIPAELIERQSTKKL